MLYSSSVTSEHFGLILQVSEPKCNTTLYISANVKTNYLVLTCVQTLFSSTSWSIIVNICMELTNLSCIIAKYSSN